MAVFTLKNIESPHCIDCEQQMHYLSHCRRIAAFFTLLGMLIGGTGVICSLIIFPLSLGSLISAVLFVHAEHRDLSNSPNIYKMPSKLEGLEERTGN